MDKFAERKKFTSCKLVAAAAVAMCLLGSAGFEANAAPAPQVVSAQKATLTISGTVKDSKGEPVIGANVMEKGTNRGIVTDLDGKFTLKSNPWSNNYSFLFGLQDTDPQGCADNERFLGRGQRSS